MRPFRSRDFRLFSASRFLALFGLQMQNVAVGWLVYELTRSAWVLGLVGLIAFVPALSLVLVTGHVADAVDRRLVMLLAHTVTAVPAFSSLPGSAPTRSGRSTPSWRSPARRAPSGCRHNRRCCRSSCRARISATRSRGTPRSTRPPPSQGRRSAACSTSLGRAWSSQRLACPSPAPRCSRARSARGRSSAHARR